MDPQELLITAARAAGVYVFMLVVIRLLGKRTVGNFSAFDLLVALMLGEVVDEIIYGDVTIARGGVAIATVALIQYANSWMAYSSPKLGHVLEGTPTTVVRDGKLERRGMAQERMSEDDVRAELRLQGIEDLDEVKQALIEVDGEVSVIRKPEAEPVQKGDLAGEKEERPTHRPRRKQAR